jgi:hypothetical protein
MFYRLSYRVAHALLYVSVLSGCARPKDANIAAFANATSALTTFAKNTGDLNVEIDGKIKLAMAADKAIAGTDTTFPAAKGVLITGESDADWKAVVAFLDAVTAYASALAKANDPSLESGLSDKITSIGSALAKVEAAKAAANSQNQARVQVIGNIAGAIINIAANLYASIQIHSAMAEAQRVLDAARDPLQAAIYDVYSSSQLKLTKYETVLWCKLTTVSGFPANSQTNAGRDPCKAFFTDLAKVDVTPANTLQRYDTYIAISEEDTGLQARLKALKDVSKAVGAMIDAHKKLMQDLDDQTALTQFLQSVGTIADNLAKLQAPQKSK